MCDPATAIAVASAVAGYAQQSSQAKSQAAFEQANADANALHIKQNAEAANNAFIEEAADTNQRLVEEEEASSDELVQLHSERLREQGHAVASSEGGGVNFDLLMGDFERQEAGYRDTVNRQLELDRLQTQREVQGLRSKAQDRINSVRPYIQKPVSQPSLIGTGLQIAGSAYSGYTSYKKRQDPKYKP